MVPVSILDLAPIVEGGTAAQALRNTRDLARHAERLGYVRYWLAEHHNVPAVASAATSVVIAMVAESTSTIRVGAGGIMLPNHPPLVIAEQFGTLESMFPGRIDLGIGRAPGSDRAAALALRRRPEGETFVQDLQQLLAFLGDPQPGDPVRAIPGAGLHVPVWVLGSSLVGADIASQLGLPFSFASHISPATTLAALERYRTRFTPSGRIARPHVMVAIHVVAADTDAEARWLYSSQLQLSHALRRGQLCPVPPPMDVSGIAGELPESPAEQWMRIGALVGSPSHISHGVSEVLATTQPDELIVLTQVFDHGARLCSYEIMAEIAAAVVGLT